MGPAATLAGKVVRGSPYLVKEVRAIVSDRTPLFVARPRVVHIWRGAPCNARCTLCPWGYLEGEALRPYVTSPFTDDLMPRALAEIAELGGRGTMVSYMGGEPTLKPRLVDWVEQARALALDFRFTTNGYQMTEELARRLVAADVFNVGVSLDALDPAVNELTRPYRGGLGTERATRAIELLLAERRRQRKHTSVNVKTVLTDVNLEAFVEIVERYGKRDGVIVTPQLFEVMEGMPEATRAKLYVKDVDRLRRVLDRVEALRANGYNVHATPEALDEFVQRYRDDPDHDQTIADSELTMSPDAPDCNIATDNLWILNGEVKLCPHHPPIGDFVAGTHTLAELWRSEEARRVRVQTRACRRLCTISCLRRTPLRHKVSTYLKLA
jgi:sulfatase maturation enzyme AslB (radical SAM superfamily)